MQGWLGEVISSSGVEQGFTKSMRALGHLQETASPFLQYCYVKLMSDTPDDDEALIHLAQRIYVHENGVSREGTRTYTLKRKRPRKETSEAAFLKRRRRGLDFIPGRDYNQNINKDFRAGPGAWTAEHDAEMEFQRDKIQKRRLQAIKENTLLPGEYNGDDKRDADSKVSEQLKAARQRDRTFRRDNEKLEGGTLPVKADLRGKTAFVTSDARCCATTLPAFGIISVHDLKLADFVITNEWAATPTQNAMKLSHFWVAALKGLRLITADLLSADGTISSAGRSLQFRSALRLQRGLFISTAFRSAHSNLANVIESIISTARHGCF